jgi:hypothetical protein
VDLESPAIIVIVANIRELSSLRLPLPRAQRHSFAVGPAIADRLVVSFYSSLCQQAGGPESILGL